MSCLLHPGEVYLARSPRPRLKQFVTMDLLNVRPLAVILSGCFAVCVRRMITLVKSQSGHMNPSKNLPTRISLLQRAQSGSDHPDWDELLQYYEPFIRRFLISMGIPTSDVDDVCQQVLSRLWQELVNYRRDAEHARFRTWLARLIRNVAINDYHKRKRAQRVGGVHLEGSDEIARGSNDLEQRVESEWQRHVVRLALERMNRIFSGNAVEVFLRSTEGETSEVIGKSLGMSVPSVYVLKNRVKKRLAREVKLLREQLEFPDTSL